MAPNATAEPAKSKNGREAEMEYLTGCFGGVDWATDPHAVCQADHRGAVVAEFDIEHSAEGLAGLCMRLARGTRLSQERPWRTGVLPGTVPDGRHQPLVKSIRVVPSLLHCGAETVACRAARRPLGNKGSGGSFRGSPSGKGVKRRLARNWSHSAFSEAVSGASRSRLVSPLWLTRETVRLMGRGAS